MNDFPCFVPHPLFRSGHQQTVLSAYLPGQRHPYQATPHVVELGDGDRIVLHDDRPPAWRPGDRVALMLHGVAGCHRSPYLVRLAAKLNRVGVRTFRMDMRGCGAGLQLAQHPGHAGRSEDASAAARFLARRCPESPCTTIGFSMGGNIVLKLLGECATQPPGNLDEGIAVSPPIDLVHCGQNIDRGWNRVYSRSFARQLVRFVAQRRKFMPQLSEITLSPTPRSIVAFDNLVTAPLSGYRDVWDYYRQASAAPHLARIKLRTLIITARDDSLIPHGMFETTATSSSTQLAITDHGGHVGYYGRMNGDPDRWWLDWRIMDWMSRAKRTHGESRQAVAAKGIVL